MKKSALLAVVIIGVAFLTAGCDIFGGKADFFPIKTGNVWNYSWTMIVSDTTMSDTSRATVKNEAKEEVELASGKKAIMFVTTVSPTGGQTFSDTTYIRKDGEKALSYDSKSDTTPETIIDGPLAIDKTWTMSEGVTAKVVAKENVTVPAGTYKNCWKVEVTDITDADTSVHHTWFADGTGQIKYHAEEEEGGMTMKLTAELTSATIK